MALPPIRWDIEPMLNAFPTAAMDGSAQEALGAAAERVVTTLGVGTGVALLLAALVVGVEALSRRRRRKPRRPRDPRPPKRRRREAYR
jgi:hypothetical protein